MKSKTVEARANLAAIRTAQAALFGENGSYVAAAPVPAAIPGSNPVPFAPLTQGFQELGFNSSGRVYFQYAVALSADRTGYTAEAAADIDDDGARQYWTYPIPDASATLVDGPIGCDAPNLTSRQIAPCVSSHGQSVF